MRFILYTLLFFISPLTLKADIWESYLGNSPKEYCIRGQSTPRFIITRYQHERVIGNHRGEGVGFEFSRAPGFWKDHLNETNSYEDCILEQAYYYLSHGHHSSYTFSNVSLNFQDMNYHYYDKAALCTKQFSVPYIKGEGHCNNGGPYHRNGVFRLYILPTTQEDSTYYFYISTSTDVFPLELKRIPESFDIIFKMVSCNRRKPD